jgi:hypothetical protein
MNNKFATVQGVLFIKNIELPLQPLKLKEKKNI